MTTKFDKQKTLDTINEWTQNCDTKASIMLAGLGVFFSIIFSSEIGKIIFRLIKINFESKTVCSVIYLCILVIASILIFLGIYEFISVLIPRIVKNGSIMFFGCVAAYKEFEQYRQAVNACCDNTLEVDLLRQIHTASKICNRKFKNHKLGIILSSIGVALFIIWFSLGIFAYYI